MSKYFEYTDEMNQLLAKAGSYDSTESMNAMAEIVFSIFSQCEFAEEVLEG